MSARGESAAGAEDGAERTVNDASLEGESAPGGGERAAPRRRARALWAVGAAGVALFAAAGAVWVLRIPIAAALIRSQLAEQGVESAFTLTALGLDGATLVDLRLGAAGAPTIAAARAELGFAWSGLSPGLAALRLDSPRLRARIDENGFSLGQLDALLEPRRPARRRASLEGLRLDIADGQALLDTPFGQLPVAIESAGVFGRDLRATARLAAPGAGTDGAGVTDARAVLTLASDARGLAGRLSGSAGALAGTGLRGEDLSLEVEFSGANDLGRGAVRGELRLRSGAIETVELEGLRLELDASADMQAAALAPQSWRVAAIGAAARVRAPALALVDARGEAEMAGDAARGAGRLTMKAAAPAQIAGFAGAFAAGADLRLELGEAPGFAASARLAGRDLALTQAGRAAFRRAWPQLGGAPIGPLFETAGEALERALANVDVEAPLHFTYSDGRAQLVFAGPATAQARSGATLRLAPLAADAPLFVYDFAGPVSGAATLTIAGGGLPALAATATRIAGGGEAPILVAGEIAAPDWRAEDARLVAPRLTANLAVDGAEGTLRVAGPAVITGPAGALHVRDMVVPADIVFSWGEGYSVAAAQDACLPIRFTGISAPSLEIGPGQAQLCPRDGIYFASSARDAVSGGFAVDNLSLAGALSGEDRQPVSISASSVNGRFSGTGARIVLDVVAEAPAMSIDLAPDRRMRIAGARLSARSESGGGAWRAAGRLADASLEDPALPARLTDLVLDWTADPDGDAVRVRIADGAARLSERPPPGADANHRPVFHPLLLRDIAAEMRAGRIEANGAILLEAGARPLGGFTATHEFESAAGQADVRIPELRFNASLQPTHLSELARGVMENVSGPVNADFQLRWRPDDVAASGRIALNDVSLASATLPIIDHVVGEIAFDDLFTLSTPPGQRLAIGRLNPGIAVENGVVQFQLLSGGRVAIEDARWPFAAGVVFVEPTTLTLGSAETRFRLILRDVDVAALLTQLRIPDLTASGKIEGEFPLLLTRTAALVENGALRSAPGGGAIAYTGSAGEGAEGAAGIAFDALTSFRYDQLTLTLDGDLGGEVVTRINFTGVNQDPVQLSELAGGVPVVGPRGIPFRFNVGVTAPFRRLAATAASVTDATSVIDIAPQRPAPAVEAEAGPPPAAEPPPAPVDPPP